MPKPGDKREDGYIWYGGSWQSPQAIERGRLRRRLYQAKNRDKARKRSKEFYEKNRESELERSRARYRANPEKWRRPPEERQRYNKAYWAANKEHLAKKARKWQQENASRVNASSKEAYITKTPTYGLTRAISDYRRGKVSGDELAKRLRDAFARGDELCERIERRGKQSKPKL